MVPIIKGIGVLAIAASLPMVAFGQQKEEILQDYTSSIKVADVNGITVMQQVGAPFGIATLSDGQDILLQGLFAALTGLDSVQTGVDGIFSDNADVSLAYDAVLKALRFSVPEDLAGCQVMVVDSNGNLVRKTAVKDNVLDLSDLTPGLYIAGVAAENKYYKTLKFIVK